MNTLVVNGDPVVYGESHAPYVFLHFVRDVTGEWDPPSPAAERVQELLKQDRMDGYRQNPPSMNVTERNFQFVADECCAEHPRKEGYDEKYTVPVKRKSKYGGSYFSARRIRGCRCSRCSDDPYNSNARAFLNEVSGVKFEI